MSGSTNAGRLLVVDDEDNLRAVLRGLLERDGYEVDEAADGREACRQLERTRYAAVLSDLRMPVLDGMGLLRWIREHAVETPVVMLTAHGSVETAVEAMRVGAFDFVGKPFDAAELSRTVGKAVAASSFRTTELFDTHPALEALVGTSPAMQRLREQVRKIAPNPTSVLLLGETGTGKELVARALHELSPRAAGPFVATNCAAIPETLVEAELFGHEKGAFSGAAHARPGRFELAEGGTLFLDEIGDMSPVVQPKILRALEQREVQRVGGGAPRPVDLRFLAATHPDLEDKVRAGEFRQDLYYRIGVLRLHLPPLRERREDLPQLIEHFRLKYQERLGKSVEPAGPPLLEALGAYSFPGNVRELENFVESLIVLSEEGRMRARDLPPLRSDPGASGSVPAVPQVGHSSLKEAGEEAKRRVESRMILDALEQSGGNVTRSAEVLGMSRKGLQLKMKEYGITRRTRAESTEEPE